MGLDDALPLRPVRLRVRGLLTHELRAVDAQLAVRHAGLHDGRLLQGGDPVAVVVRRPLHRKLVVRIVGDHHAQVVALHQVVPGTGSGRIQHLEVAGKPAQPQPVVQLLGTRRRRVRRFRHRTHEDAPGVGLTVLRLRLPSRAVGTPGESQEITLVAAVDERLRPYRHPFATGAAAERLRMRLKGGTDDPAPFPLHRGRHHAPQHPDAHLASHQLLDHLPRRACLEVAVGVPARAGQRSVVLGRVMPVALAVVVEQRLAQLVVDRRPAALPLGVPHAQARGEHAAEVWRVGDQHDLQPLARGADGAREPRRCSRVHAYAGAHLPRQRHCHGSQ